MSMFRDPRAEIHEQLRALMPSAERIEIHEVRIDRDGTTFNFAARFGDGWLTAESVRYSSDEHSRLVRAMFSPPE